VLGFGKGREGIGLSLCVQYIRSSRFTSQHLRGSGGSGGVWVVGWVSQSQSPSLSHCYIAQCATAQFTGPFYRSQRRPSFSLPNGAIPLSLFCTSISVFDGFLFRCPAIRQNAYCPSLPHCLTASLLPTPCFTRPLLYDQRSHFSAPMAHHSTVYMVASPLFHKKQLNFRET
jgi:hypothetical protein